MPMNSDAGTSPSRAAAWTLLSSVAGLLLLLLGLGALPLRAQDATITGRILSAESGEPIGGAEIRLAGTRRGAVTSDDGLFRIENLPAGEHLLTIEYLGAQSKSFRVRLGVHESVSVSFKLRMKVIPVPELEVTVNDDIPVGKLYSFYRRAETSPGYFISRDDIAERRPSRTTDLLRQVPGVDIGPPHLGRTAVRMGRGSGCVPDYYLDGAHAPFYDMDNLQPIDVAGIEIYRGNSEVPPEFNRPGTCGVIVIWTRDPSNWRNYRR